MVSALDSSPGFSANQGSLCCVLGQDTLLSQCASLHPEYKWVLTNCCGNLTKCWGGNLRWTSILSRGSSRTPSRLHATETGLFYVNWANKKDFKANRSQWDCDKSTYISSVFFIRLSDDNKYDKITQDNYSHRHNNCNISCFTEIPELEQDLVKIDGIRFN